MARPTTNTVEFFPHFTNASDKRTLVIFEGQYGAQGYSFWFKLLEYLGKTEGHYFDARKNIDLEFLVRKCGVSLITGTEMLDKLAFLDAIDHSLWGKRVIWSQNFVNNLVNVYNKRGRALPPKPDFWHDNGNHHEEPTDISGTEILASNSNPQLLRTEMPQSIDSKESIVKNIYTHWNSKGIITHQKLTERITRKVASTLKDYSEQEITKAIDNYANILAHPETYYFNHKWTLDDFLQRGLGKFMENASPLKNFTKDGKSKDTGTPPPEGTYAHLAKK